MNTFKKLVPFCFFLFISCNEIAKDSSRLKKNLKGTVVRIIDGDTFDMLTKQNKVQRIRMNGIDCPERSQDYYTVAKNALEKYIFRQEVELKTFNKDRYGRTIANVYLNNNNINIAMVKNGYAWYYKLYSSDINLDLAEKEAKFKKVGLWRMPSPIAPWDFRKNKK